MSEDRGQSPAVPAGSPAGMSAIRAKTILPEGDKMVEHPAEFDAEFPTPGLVEQVRQVMEGGAGSPQEEISPPSGRLSRTDRLLLDAQELFGQAHRCSEEARQRASEIEREAYEKGFQQGEAAGLEMGQAKLASMLAEINTLLKKIAGAHGEVVKANTDQLFDLAVAIAIRLLHRELELRPEQILATAQEVLSLVGHEQRVSLRLSQSDFQMLIDHQDHLPALIHLGDHLTFEVDPDMIKGGCLVQTPTGSIDATIETMFAEMRRTLVATHTGSDGP